MNNSSKVIFLRWEKWRIGYNLILFVESLWLLWDYLKVALADWRFMVLFAVAANVCYSLGPVLEIGVKNLVGSRTDRTRYRSFLAGVSYFLFWVGLAFSILFVYILVSQGMEYLDGSSDSPHPYF